MDYFSYNDGAGIVPPDAFRISASQISRFFDKTSEWYHEFLLDGESFTGSTATELGNCVHASAAMYTDSGTVDVDAINSYIASIDNPDIDTDYISDSYPAMVEALINNYLAHNVPSHREEFIWKEILPGIGVGGSCDAYRAENIQYFCDDEAYKFLTENNIS